MAFRINHTGAINHLAIMCGTASLIAASLFTGVAIGEGHQISDKYSMEVDPAAKQQLGEQTFNEVMLFFRTAEKAIETKDLKALMALYSDNYRDGDHDKKSAEQTWQRIFATFDTMVMSHRMKFEKCRRIKTWLFSGVMAFWRVRRAMKKCLLPLITGIIRIIYWSRKPAIGN